MNFDAFPTKHDHEELSITLPKRYWNLIQNFLYSLSERFSRAGCNVFIMPGTKFFYDLDREANPEKYKELEKSKTQLELPFDETNLGPIYTMDFIVLEYLLRKLEEQNPNETSV